MPARFTLPAVGARAWPSARISGLALVVALMATGLSGCRPPAPADGVVESPASSSRPVATLGPDDAVPSVTEGAVAVPAPMAQLEPTSADQMKRTIDATGKVELHVVFDTDGTSLKADAVQVLDEIVALLHNDPALKLSIDAHTDGGGNAGRNRELTQQRADTVRAALIANGIDADRLQARGLGADQLVADRDGADSRRNLRVELVRLD